MQLAQIYRCLCDPTRLRIVHLLTHGPLCVCHIQDILGLPQVVVSKHLAYLRQKGMVEARRHRQWMIYALPSHAPPELAAHLRCLEECAETQPVLRKDLRRLQERHRFCKWIGQVFATAAPRPAFKTTRSA
ncbi:MAG: metalloregulator ArsR/SmtB family transcription factor [Limisphaera sp.]